MAGISHRLAQRTFHRLIVGRVLVRRATLSRCDGLCIQAVRDHRFGRGRRKMNVGLGNVALNGESNQRQGGDNEPPARRIRGSCVRNTEAVGQQAVLAVSGRYVARCDAEVTPEVARFASLRQTV